NPLPSGGGALEQSEYEHARDAPPREAESKPLTASRQLRRCDEPSWRARVCGIATSRDVASLSSRAQWTLSNGPASRRAPVRSAVRRRQRGRRSAPPSLSVWQRL